MTVRNFGRMAFLAAAAASLAACEPGTNPFAGARSDGQPTVDATLSARPSTAARMVDRDVEAPEVFSATDEALWDGRPSLGGVWVASPDAKDPERVILRNPGNGKTVIGALFRRERDNPGPKLQISSDAAEALGMLAGQPATLAVTALRRAEASVAEPDAAEATDSADATVAIASAAIDAAEGATAVTTAPLDEPAAPVATAVPATATTGPLRVQIGIFSVEANADRAAATLTKAGVAAEVRPENSAGKSIWSVVASGGGDKAALLTKIKGLGFADAYTLR